MARKGVSMSVARTHRLWRSAGLQVPRKRPRKRIAKGRPRPTPPNSPNHVWAIDFVFDTLADGRSLKCLTVVDRVDAGMPGDRRGKRDPRRSRRRGSLSPREPPRRSPLPALRQWPRVRLPRSLALDDEGGYRNSVHRPRQTLAERNQRELQRPLSRWMPEHGMVPLTHRGEGHHRDVAQTLQRRPTPFESRRHNADRVHVEIHEPRHGNARGIYSFPGSTGCGQVTIPTTAGTTRDVRNDANAASIS